ncbi:hypothetical protein AB0I22_19005 [Streptomyces sp. NPDC050610]|uniref:hypothetical protein n=1 Tax=Streptomyces sp. NPDC050610 TaxID=3157097 RepID=UPI003434A0A2
MVRNALGSVLALIGAAAAVWSPFRAWYDGRHGRDYRVQDLFDGITGTHAELMGSIFLPMVFVGLVTLIGLLLRSRLLIALAGLVTLGFTVLWMVRQGQQAGDLTVDSDGNGLNMGVAIALGGGVLLLLAAVLMSGRRGTHRRRRRAPEPEPAQQEPAQQEPTGYGQPMPYERPAEQPPHYEQPPQYERPHEGAYTQPHEGAYAQPYEQPYEQPREEKPYSAPHGASRDHGHDRDHNRDRGADETQANAPLADTQEFERPPAAEENRPAPPPRDGR